MGHSCLSFSSSTLLALLIFGVLNNGFALNFNGPYGGQATLFSRSDPLGRECLSTGDIPVGEVGLTDEERSVLDFICWQNQSSLTFRERKWEDEEERGAILDRSVALTVRNGIPAGISCKPIQWCDGSGACTIVCDRGSVFIEPWLAHAVKLQAKLARGLPFCFTTLFGTHNSAITLADGYGNLDLAWQSLFKYIKWVVPDAHKRVLRTNNQWLSITDQLNLGVRVVEIDTHWVGDVLRIAHCGGLHVEALNVLVRALNTVAKLLGHDIRWDTETMGCNPSLSSIPALEQRTLVDALTEIADWMNAEENKDEFLVLYFDDQPDLSTWVSLPSQNFFVTLTV